MHSGWHSTQFCAQDTLIISCLRPLRHMLWEKTSLKYARTRPKCSPIALLLTCRIISVNCISETAARECRTDANQGKHSGHRSIRSIGRSIDRFDRFDRFDTYFGQVGPKHASGEMSGSSRSVCCQSFSLVRSLVWPKTTRKTETVKMWYFC